MRISIMETTWREQSCGASDSDSEEEEVDSALLFLGTRSAYLEILGFPIGGAPKYRDIFALFKTMRRKQNLA